MGLKTSAPGHYLIPAAPVVGTAVAQSASANTFGAYVQMIAAAASALLITGIYVELASGASLPTYVSYEIGVGAGGAEVLQDTGNVPFGPSSGVAATQALVYKPIFPPVPVANGARIAVKTASSIASALGWAVTLECIAVTNVVDDGVGVTLAASQLTVKKNAALSAFMFLMVQAADHVTPAPGLTVTAQRALDGAAFGACANAVTEIANGWYKLDLAAADLNGNNVALRFSAATADITNLLIITQA